LALDNDIATLCVGPSLKKALQIETALLKQYVGSYGSDPQHIAIITLENGQLQMKAKGGDLPMSTLFAKSNNYFRLKFIDEEVELVKDNTNKVTELILHFKGQNQVAKKVK
jgi:hypothetical protein